MFGLHWDDLHNAMNGLSSKLCGRDETEALLGRKWRHSQHEPSGPIHSFCNSRASAQTYVFVIGEAGDFFLTSSKLIYVNWAASVLVPYVTIISTFCFKKGKYYKYVAILRNKRESLFSYAA